jgi:hypothetical protein
MAAEIIDGNRTLIDGIPERITREKFLARFAQNFPDLIPSDQSIFVNMMISDVYTQFIGIPELWASIRDKVVYYDKVQLCYIYLTAWLITDTNPDLSFGIPSSGGIAVKEKKIGGVVIKFGSPEEYVSSGGKQFRDSLACLKSNTPGKKAYDMIMNSSAIRAIRGGKQ